MQTSIVGLSILWGLASFGVQGDFIESRDSVAPSWQAESRVEMEGYLIESLGEDRWLFDNGSESLLVSLPEGQWVPTGERLRVSGEPQQEQSGGHESGEREEPEHAPVPLTCRHRSGKRGADREYTGTSRVLHGVGA